MSYNKLKKYKQQIVKQHCNTVSNKMDLIIRIFIDAKGSNLNSVFFLFLLFMAALPIIYSQFLRHQEIFGDWGCNDF